ncbi:ribonuclease H1 [Aricia agestis]|uniref:ribonuclease H1 n=1 Tax=Aricia agestis TaxID=91739 RepID=UPI001C204E52|nr:ribonuclease H1 [Aricia agestis]
MIWKILGIRQAFSLLSLSKTISVMPFYAVAKGRVAGIYMTWPDCEAQVKGFPGARYKKFNSVVEAEDFITTNSGTVAQNNTKPSSAAVKNSNPSLKRSYSTAANNKNNDNTQKKTVKKSRKSDTKNNEWSDSEDSEDLTTIITKQMDDIEKRLTGFQKGVDKIYKQSAKNKKTILLQDYSSSNSFQTDHNGYVQVYTDGACSSNGRNGARAGLGVYWGEGHPLNLSAPVSGRATNNCGEIQAATKAIRTALDNGVTKLSINTDSKFLINSVTKWMTGWKRNGWKLKSGEPVKNEVDFKELDSLQNKLQIKWNYVEAHQGIHGNEMADQLAKAGAAMYNL